MGALWPDPHGTLRRLGIDGGTLADVACGDGYFTVPAADIDAVEPIQGDARVLPSLLPEPVETVLLANTFHGVADGAAFAETVSEALTTGGRFVVVNWHAQPPEATTVLDEPRGPPEPLRLTPTETEAVVEPAGFEQLDTVELEPHRYGIVFRRA